MYPISDVPCKLVLVGNGSVGKTSIITRFTADGFHRSYKQTVGVDFFEKKIQVGGDRLRMTMQVWDIGGQSINSPMLPKYLCGARMVFLCYDVTDSHSFNDLDDWLGAVVGAFANPIQHQPQTTISTSPKTSPDIYLVGNKIDLYDLRETSKASHDKFITDHALAGGGFCSASSGENVLRYFYAAASKVVGIILSEHELAFFDRPLGIPVVAAKEEARTPWADEIEAEDRALEAAKTNHARKMCSCM